MVVPSGPYRVPSRRINQSAGGEVGRGRLCLAGHAHGCSVAPPARARPRPARPAAALSVWAAGQPRPPAADVLRHPGISRGVPAMRRADGGRLSGPEKFPSRRCPARLRRETRALAQGAAATRGCNRPSRRPPAGDSEVRAPWQPVLGHLTPQAGKTRTRRARARAAVAPAPCEGARAVRSDRAMGRAGCRWPGPQCRAVDRIRAWPATVCRPTGRAGSPCAPEERRGPMRQPHCHPRGRAVGAGPAGFDPAHGVRQGWPCRLATRGGGGRRGAGAWRCSRPRPDAIATLEINGSPVFRRQTLGVIGCRIFGRVRETHS